MYKGATLVTRDTECGLLKDKGIDEVKLVVALVKRRMLALTLPSAVPFSLQDELRPYFGLAVSKTHLCAPNLFIRVYLTSSTTKLVRYIVSLEQTLKNFESKVDFLIGLPYV